MEFTYDAALVTLSIAVATLGAFTGLVMTTGIRRIRGMEAALRIGLGSIGIGGGIWGMHFIAMLAMIMPVKLDYDVVQTVISAVIAIVFTAIAFVIVSRNAFGKWSIPVSAVFLGLGISGMHYIGMFAIRGNAAITYSWLGVAISMLIAVQASAVALWFAFRERGLLDTLLGAIALGLAIASMHFTAMETTHFMPVAASEPFVRDVESPRHLAITISIAVYGVCGVAIFVFAALTYARRLAVRRQSRAAG
ncbi:MAG: MHYT domain-containing protein [Rhodomicrobiaceae bacterium]